MLVSFVVPTSCDEFGDSAFFALGLTTAFSAGYLLVVRAFTGDAVTRVLAGDAVVLAVDDLIPIVYEQDKSANCSNWRTMGAYVGLLTWAMCFAKLIGVSPRML